MGTGSRGRVGAALIALVLAAGAWPDHGRGGTSFIPIPEIVTDPNEGNTFGLLGVVLFTDEKDEIRYMLAPDISYNETKGAYPVFRLFGYPNPDRRYSVTLGKSTTKDENYELEFTDRGYWDRRAFVAANIIFERDSTERFFGLGNDSDEDRESNYTGNLTRGLGSVGVWILPYVNVAYEMRAELPNRDQALKPGQFVRVQLKGAVRKNAVSVPQTAVLDGPQGKFVYVPAKDKDGKDIAQPRPVALGPWVTLDGQNLWIVESGLAAGDKVIVDGVARVMGPGSPIMTGPPPGAPGAPGTPSTPVPKAKDEKKDDAKAAPPAKS